MDRGTMTIKPTEATTDTAAEKLEQAATKAAKLKQQLQSPPGPTDPPAEPADLADDPEPDGTEPGDKAGKEAAKYRHQLRTVEAERDQLTATVEKLQQNIVESLAKSQLSVPGDLLSIGTVTLSDLVNEDGMPDTAKVTAALAQLLKDRPGLSSSVHPGVGQGHHSAGTSKAPGFGSAFAPKSQRS